MPSKPAAAGAGIFSWILFLGYSAFVFQGAILKPGSIPLFLTRFNDKLIHAFFYFILFWTALFAFKNSKWVYLRVLPAKSALVYCALMGIATEVSQIFVPGRACEAADWSADVIGAAFGLFLYSLFVRWRKQ